MKAINRIARDRSSAYAGMANGFFGGGAKLTVRRLGRIVRNLNRNLSRNAGKAKGSGF